MSLRHFHFKNVIPINFLFTQWKWAYILDFGPQKWSALNMKFMDKWPSRMQGPWSFQNRADMQQFFGQVQKIWIFRMGGCPYPNLPPWKVHEGSVTSSISKHGTATSALGRGLVTYLGRTWADSSKKETTHGSKHLKCDQKRMGFLSYTFQVTRWHFRCTLVKEHFHFLLVGILTTPVCALW